MRIGVISDNHSRSNGADLPQAVLDTFAGADLIVHCGDAGSWGTLDRLATVAPVVGVLAKGGQNGQGTDDRIDGDHRVLDLGGLRAGVVHDLVTQGLATEMNPRIVPTASLPSALRSFFGEAIDVLLYGGTHVGRIAYVPGTLLVNPGSPTLLVGRPPGSPGTIAVIDIEGGVVSPRIVDLAGA